jgi:hypothetical protein
VPIRPGQGFDGGSRNPRIGDRFSTPSGFRGAPVTINQFNQGGANGGFAPSSAIPGRPNFSGGSTGATLRPVSPIRGGPNPGNPGFIPDAVMDARLFGDSSVRDGALNNFRLPIRAPVGGTVPNFSVTPQAPVAPSTLVVPVTPQTDAVSELPLPADAQSSANADIRPNVEATAVEPVFEPQGVATATAFPVRERARAEATATAPQRTTLRSAPTDSAEIPSGGGGPRRTGFRGNTQSADAASGYTLWQGYYWYHNPTAGWHYWDGSRWTRF